jgi:hypothetical protein
LLLLFKAIAYQDSSCFIVEKLIFQIGYFGVEKQQIT